MIMAAKSNKILSQKGQGLVEFLLFLPFMLMMYSVILTISNAMNASINQQKIARGFFYYSVQNNSMMPIPSRKGEEPSSSWRYFGTQVIGWADSFDGESSNPIAPCFKLRLPLGTGEDDACEEGYTDPTTQFIRVSSVYGVCGATMENQNGQRLRYPIAGGANLVVSENACQITR
jgi:hypothetical protein